MTWLWNDAALVVGRTIVVIALGPGLALLLIYLSVATIEKCSELRAKYGPQWFLFGGARAWTGEKKNTTRSHL